MLAHPPQIKHPASLFSILCYWWDSQTCASKWFGRLIPFSLCSNKVPICWPQSICLYNIWRLAIYLESSVATGEADMFRWTRRGSQRLSIALCGRFVAQLFRCFISYKLFDIRLLYGVLELLVFACLLGNRTTAVCYPANLFPHEHFFFQFVS